MFLVAIVRARAVLGPLVVAAVLVYILHPAVRALRRTGLGVGPSVLVTYLLGLAALGLVGFALVPAVAWQGHRLLQAIPAYTRHAEHLVDTTRGAYLRTRLPLPVRRGIDREVAAVGGFVTQAVTDVVTSLVHVVPSMLAYALAPVVSYYLLKELGDGPAVWERILEPRQAVAARRIAARVDRVLGGYLRGQVLAATMVAVLVFASLTALGLPYAVLVALLAGVTDMVPYVGPFIGALPAVIIAAGRSPASVLAVVIVFLAIHELEGSLLAPRLLGHGAQLRPLTVVVALMLGEGLFGFWGLIVAVPVAAVGRVLVREAFRWAVRPRTPWA